MAGTGFRVSGVETGTVQEQLTRGLKNLLQRVKAGLRSPRFLKELPKRSPAPIATCDETDRSFVLVLVPVNLKAVLTDRELQVVLGVRVCLPNKAIARGLGLSESTIVAHLRRIYKTLGINSRLELALLAIGLKADEWPVAVAT